MLKCQQAQVDTTTARLPSQRLDGYRPVMKRRAKLGWKRRIHFPKKPTNWWTVLTASRRLAERKKRKKLSRRPEEKAYKVKHKERRLTAMRRNGNKQRIVHSSMGLEPGTVSSKRGQKLMLSVLSDA